MCDVYTNVLTCYNNCPKSNERPPVQNQVTQFCQAADPYVLPTLPDLGSASSSTRFNMLIICSLRAAASASQASVASVAATQSKAATATSSPTGTSTSSVTPTGNTFETNAAGAVGVPAGAALVAFLGYFL